ncbi:dTDP-3-amino-3,4, 6-trideoxy-alpha-D-glucopyranose [Geobacter sp. OR-1]|uniref:class I SAM-dependent DNA methyltransferase n=1 Tax=Geobacter sp. OR-1 TaxID=1266765 RepID=UPI000542CCAB|nr:class I SAM-dependent methyltransferase [Geobacter sp. OR-1]GAM09924.1 dTDP-3-amino-3,4, 6-trideoxy-alpha-D-glucopyranose [Geobacter sp. OR-1]
MTVFADYSRYYDLLYRDKDYATEVDFVEQLIRAHCPSASAILELGCGTGRHAELLAERGYRIHGVDLSEGMLASAEQRRQVLSDAMREKLAFSHGDVRSVRIPERFDTVVSLFHVASYMTANNDLEQLFATASMHLQPGGLFLFDCWYGPAVLEDRPSVRVKRLADEELEITRIAEPVMHPNENVVDVNYEVHIFNRKTQAHNRVKECHRMRYLFVPEMQSLFASHGMIPVFFTEWLTGREPGFDTWNICVGGVVQG